MRLENEVIEIYRRLSMLYYATLGATGAAKGMPGTPGFMPETSEDEIMNVYVSLIYSLINRIDEFIRMIDCTEVRLKQIKNGCDEIPGIVIG